MKRIIVYGGAFNPPTIAHEKLSLAALEYIGGDEMCFVPVADTYDKPRLLESKHRVAMLNILKDKYKGKIGISEYEVNHKDMTYTCDTLEYISKSNEGCEIFFLMGADNLSYFSKWKNSVYMLENYRFLVLKRDGYNIDKLLKEDDILNEHRDSIIILPDTFELMVSSTMVRDMIFKKDSRVLDLLDKNIYKYINKNLLYISRGDSKIYD